MKQNVPFIALGLLCSPWCALAQSEVIPTVPAPLEVTLSFSAIRSHGSPAPCGCFWLQGGKAEFSAVLGRRFSLAGEVAAHHVAGINSAKEDLGLTSYLFGPRYSFRQIRGLVPFAQVLVGGVHGFDAYFPNTNGFTTTPDAFAIAAGGGVNIRLSHHLAFRPIQVDYFRTQLPNDASNREASLRLGGGIIFAVGFPR